MIRHFMGSIINFFILKEKFADPALEMNFDLTEEKAQPKRNNGNLNVLVWGPDLSIAPPASQLWASK